MDKINSEKEFPKLILYLGSFLFISFLIIELICSFRNVFPLFRTGWLNTYVAGVFCRRLGFIPFLIGIILLVPITEEIVFRKWADYKKHSFFLSTICISLYLFISISWLAGIVAVAYFAIVFVTCGKKRIKVYRFLMLFATSFAFALTFNFRTTSIGILTVSDFLKNFGFSMVASYLVSNHSFTHSILLRMAYNVLLFVPMFLPCNLDVDGAKVNVGGIYSTAEGYYSFEETDSSFVFKGTMPEIAYKMAIDINMDTASDKNIFYDYCSSPDYVFSIEINNKSKEFLKKTLKEMNRHKMFIADTLYRPIYYLSISSHENLNNNHSGNYCIRDVIFMLRHFYAIPVKPNYGVNVLYPCDYGHVDVAKMKKRPTLDEVKKTLEEIGLTIEENPHFRAQVITFKYFW